MTITSAGDNYIPIDFYDMYIFLVLPMDPGIVLSIFYVLTYLILTLS
jgi:hypothetical protein